MRDYLNRLRQQFQRFMIGRYGMDQFGRFSSLLLALIIFNFLIPAALPFQNPMGTGMDRAHYIVCKNVFQKH